MTTLDNQTMQLFRAIQALNQLSVLNALAAAAKATALASPRPMPPAMPLPLAPVTTLRPLVLLGTPPTPAAALALVSNNSSAEELPRGVTGEREQSARQQHRREGRGNAGPPIARGGLQPPQPHDLPPLQPRRGPPCAPLRSAGVMLLDSGTSPSQGPLGAGSAGTEAPPMDRRLRAYLQHTQPTGAAECAGPQGAVSAGPEADSAAAPSGAGLTDRGKAVRLPPSPAAREEPLRQREATAPAAQSGGPRADPRASPAPMPDEPAARQPPTPVAQVPLPGAGGFLPGTPSALALALPGALSESAPADAHRMQARERRSVMREGAQIPIGSREPAQALALTPAGEPQEPSSRAERRIEMPAWQLTVRNAAPAQGGVPRLDVPFMGDKPDLPAYLMFFDGMGLQRRKHAKPVRRRRGRSAADAGGTESAHEGELHSNAELPGAAESASLGDASASGNDVPERRRD